MELLFNDPKLSILIEVKSTFVHVRLTQKYYLAEVPNEFKRNFDILNWTPLHSAFRVTVPIPYMGELLIPHPIRISLISL